MDVGAAGWLETHAVWGIPSQDSVPVPHFPLAHLETGGSTNRGREHIYLYKPSGHLREVNPIFFLSNTAIPTLVEYKDPTFVCQILSPRYSKTQEWISHAPPHAQRLRKANVTFVIELIHFWVMETVIGKQKRAWSYNCDDKETRYQVERALGLSSLFSSKPLQHYIVRDFGEVCSLNLGCDAGERTAQRLLRGCTKHFVLTLGVSTRRGIG